MTADAKVPQSQQVTPPGEWSELHWTGIGSVTSVYKFWREKRGGAMIGGSVLVRGDLVSLKYLGMCGAYSETFPSFEEAKAWVECVVATYHAVDGFCI